MYTFNGSFDAKSVYFLVFMFSCESGNEHTKKQKWAENTVCITVLKNKAIFASKGAQD